MKKYKAFFAFSLLLSIIPNLFSQKVTEKNYVDFIPISPIQVKTDLLSTTSSNNIELKSTYEISLDKKEVLNLIPNESMETTLQKFDELGEVSFLYSGRSVKKGTYRLTVDYSKYIIQNIEDSSLDGCLSYAKLGIGLRIVANINALSNNIDISSLIAIGNAAKEGKVAGTVGYQVIGIESKEVTAILPINSEITSSLNQVFLQSLSTVKGKIYDEKTRLHPQIIAIKNSGCDTKTVTRNLLSQFTPSNNKLNLLTKVD